MTVLTLLSAPPEASTRRQLLTGAFAVGSLMLAGCSAGRSDGPAISSAAPGFPVSIAHRFGSTEIVAEPTKIVCVGFTDHDALLALDVVPLATSNWIPGGRNNLMPWALEALGDRPLPQAIDTSDGLDLEAVAALQPDLILGLYAGLTAEQYAKLSTIAPTVAQPADVPDYTISWQEQLLTAGRVTGRTTRAEALVAELQARLDRAITDHPQFAGKTAVSASAFAGGYAAVTAADPAGRTLTQLGLVTPPAIDALAGDSYYTDISPERLDLFEVDVLFVNLDAGYEAQLGKDKLFQALEVVKNGRVVYVPFPGGTVDHAVYTWVTALSLPAILDRVVPELMAALDGDPATVVPDPPVLAG